MGSVIIEYDSSYLEIPVNCRSYKQYVHVHICLPAPQTRHRCMYICRFTQFFFSPLALPKLTPYYL